MNLSGPQVVFSGGGGGSAPSAPVPLRAFASGLWYGPKFYGSSPGLLAGTLLRFSPWMIPPGGLALSAMWFTVTSRTGWPVTTTNTLSIAWFGDSGGRPASRTVTLGTYVLKRNTSTEGDFPITGLTATVPAGPAWFCALLRAPSTRIGFSPVTTNRTVAGEAGSFYSQRPRKTYLGTTAFGFNSRATFTAIPANAPAAATLVAVEENTCMAVAVLVRCVCQEQGRG